MWFKNLKLYRFTQPFTFDDEKLDSMMQSMPFRACSAQDVSQKGKHCIISPAKHIGLRLSAKIKFCRRASLMPNYQKRSPKLRLKRGRQSPKKHKKT